MEASRDTVPDADASDGVTRSRGSIKFDWLRLDGFKSFPDRTEISIRPGLTGVVGPNGCGKSNLLEALRWGMGETSASRMRGERMDDVIFGGTDARPPRNIAEVVLGLDNRARAAPAALNGSDVVEVSRRIERGQGTAYRVNGQAEKQRDVQILFSDNAAGATSPAIVSQNRVAALIGARPSERRNVLEEAAGVSGLAARRHDTSLKIKATEANILRADDALASSGETLAGLRRQARQVQRRREIDALVEKALATWLHLRHVSSSAQETQARAGHEANEKVATEVMLDVAGKVRSRDGCVALLAPAREARSQAEAGLVRAQTRLETVEGESRRAAVALDEARRRVFEAAADRQRVDSEIVDGEVRARTLDAERIELAERRAQEAQEVEAASDALEAARVALAEADKEQSEAGLALAGVRSTREQAVRARDEASRRVDAVARRTAEAQARLASLAPSPDLGERAAAARLAASDAEQAVVSSSEALTVAEAAFASARTASEVAGRHADAARADVARVRAELQGLQSVRARTPSRDPVAARMTVRPGFEAAVASAFGESATWGTDPSEATWWEVVPRPPDLWDGGTLADVMDPDAVPELTAFARSVAICDDDDLQGFVERGLPPGCSVVSRSGMFARWDGFRGRSAGDEVRGALERANRVRALSASLADMEAVQARALASDVEARARVDAAKVHEAAARSASRSAYERARETQSAAARLTKEFDEAFARQSVAEAEVASLVVQRDEAQVILTETSRVLASSPDDAAASARLASARAAVAAGREAEGSARTMRERLVVESNARRVRFEASTREAASVARRLGEVRALRDELGTRAETAKLAMEVAEAAVVAAPADVVESLSATVREAKAVVQGRRSDEAGLEAVKEASEAAVREAEARLAGVREERARLLAGIEVAQAARLAVEADVVERLRCAVADLPAMVGPSEGGAPATAEVAASRLQRLERERESLGAVNFLAEEELKEHEARFGAMEKARGELKETVAGLRKALDGIEREARAKLDTAFRVIDGHFGNLFATLFSGGEAHLRLVGSEDVLEAGLEIYASPPGKRMQNLSLLSGGEQALTAMALIFAAFMSNPAPICVLDEVDAPLDDANADRLCRLMETMAVGDATRFLCITHNPLTMARMNRLYGVTMAERGVSSVTTVDLDKAIRIVES